MSNANPKRDVRLRRAEDPGDTGTVRELFREYQEAIGVDLCFQGFAAELAALPGPYSPPRGGLWLAEVDGAAVGCIALREIDPERAEMKRLFVRPAGRGLGLGRRLVGILVDEARRLGYRAVCL